MNTMNGLKVLACGSALFLSGTMAKATNFSGFYVGLQGGGAYSFVDYKNTITDGPYQSTGTTFSSKMSDKDFIGGFFLGWGKTFQNFYLGGEVEALFQSISVLEKNEQLNSLSNMEREASIKANDKYDASLRFGFLIKPCSLLYFKTGISSGNYKVKVSYPSNPWATSDDKKNLTGFNGALGVEFKATPKINIGCEIGYTRFKKFETKQDIISECSFKPEQYNMKVRLSYLF